ncbi:MAG: hypothetical protein A3G52_02685 [Candidatus Taylorbacteria bacterium RIFCSPLOWO2_12_FULL_43_20]|uniref:Uncharacterized protein n=1 Tax=Candidatus Taylorbacteria bacterium RIFCSPLOWO2_12_FULL_43_20 TaxID=1802332 RepID=A0A1G2NZQ9_9BACT|nr:MAG: hypothetical protein A3B98_03180 [Candidatus Taylorbacteria bacterium RIFCSPHIGHO2_02_FULL_43_55]OHA28107.1 MAG: hypothetical protein A3E92_00170 [Candidatus Taylorbacteria bacterium RIFCSPHIGHO2_12_FULL_42_34]OHA32320.1 MAG: hypothetical protein A3B09_03090 [Candidatus Taylorbacteria bacterium RIFCSPLOWO2_01_FULL_43_83]OHA37657.1 MAG: hypothetical protein A3H58_03210 [Candidatus Taylorbacteria bacterium RIFCSPLOWO2_02_FULL_43_22b]OHA41548.1 MAG: hypothetical protein A3G52_02685 [Candid
MPESFNLFEDSPDLSREVIDRLNAVGIEDAQTLEMVNKYVDLCHAEANEEAAADPQSAEVSNRANIKAEIRIARLFLATLNYKDRAKEILQDVLEAAYQNESTLDLASEIETLLRDRD